MDERAFLSRLLSGGGEIWLAVAYVAAMITAVAFRSHQIGYPAMFRMSYILFAFYLIVPSLFDGIVALLTLDNARYFRDNQGIGMSILSPTFNFFGKLLFAGSVVCALACFRVGERPRSIQDHDMP